MIPAVRRYQATQSDITNQRRTLMEHYQRAIELVSGAEAAFARGREEEAIELIGRGQAAVGELTSGLDRAGGGALAQNLDRLYEFINRRLGEAAAARETRPLAEVAVLLEGLLDAWRQAYQFTPNIQHQNNQERLP